MNFWKVCQNQIVKKSFLERERGEMREKFEALDSVGILPTKNPSFSKVAVSQNPAWVSQASEQRKVEVVRERSSRIVKNHKILDWETETRLIKGDKKERK